MFFLGWGLGVPVAANVDVHLGVPKSRGNVDRTALEHVFEVAVGVPLHSTDLRVQKVIVVKLLDVPSAVLVNVLADFLGGMFVGDFDRANFGGGCGVAHV